MPVSDVTGEAQGVAGDQEGARIRPRSLAVVEAVPAYHRSSYERFDEGPVIAALDVIDAHHPLGESLGRKQPRDQIVLRRVGYGELNRVSVKLGWPL